jgi:hypothetical protein
VPLERVEVVLEQLVPTVVRDRRLRVVEQRRDVVLRRAAPAALVVDEVRLVIDQHDVARLEVAVQEVARVRAQQEVRERLEVVLEPLLVERDVRQLQEVVLEVVQVPQDRLRSNASRG